MQQCKESSASEEKDIWTFSYRCIFHTGASGSKNLTLNSRYPNDDHDSLIFLNNSYTSSIKNFSVIYHYQKIKIKKANSDS